MNQKKRRKLSGRTIIFLAVAAVLLIAVCGTVALFLPELRILATVQRLDTPRPAYTMQIDSYHFDEFLAAGGASSDAAVSAFLTGKISHGFYTVDVNSSGLACSTLSAKAAGGAHLWGRNFDWDGSVPIVVKSRPENGYASISTCDFKNVTGSPDILPEGTGNQMLAIAALYVPVDGVNEAGLCVADLEVNEGGMLPVDTEKPDLTVTTAIRLLLNEAATVDEAIALLEQYDIHASGGISHHLAISDASGASVVVEFIAGEAVVLDTNVVTNFNLANGDTAAGGESARQRYESLSAAYEKSGGVFAPEQMRAALAAVAQDSAQQSTQWSIVYDQAALTATYYFSRDYEAPYVFAFASKAAS